MSYEITRVVVWAGEFEDRTGSLADMLDSVLGAGANLDCLIARPEPDRPGRSVLFITPLIGPQQTATAEKAGMKPATSLLSIRVEGPNRPRIASRIARTLAATGVDVRGLNATVVEDRCVFYIGFRSEEDLLEATAALNRELKD